MCCPGLTTRGSQHEQSGLVWEDVEGQESFPVSAGFELITHGLLVQEHNYSATTHNPCEVREGAVQLNLICGQAREIFMKYMINRYNICLYIYIYIHT